MVKALSPDELKELRGLAKLADPILTEEMIRAGLTSEHSRIDIYNVRSVGVQGDGRSYTHPAEITIHDLSKMNDPAYPTGRPCTDAELYELLATISTRVTNEVKGISRVTYFLAGQD